MKANLETDLFFKRLVEEGKFSVTKQGVVTNLLSGKVVGSINGNYYRVGAKDFATNIIRVILVHRLVWIVYCGEIPEGFVINHIDGDKLNNALTNLEVVSTSRNNQHAWEIGLMKASESWVSKQRATKSGSHNGMAKLSDADISYIRNYPKGYGSTKLLAQEFDVCIRTIQNVRKGVSYKNSP